MVERFILLAAYVGSAAWVAFLAVCLTSPRVDTFRCDVHGANGAQRCEVVASLAAYVPADSGAHHDGPQSAAEAAKSASMAVQD